MWPNDAELAGLVRTQICLLTSVLYAYACIAVRLCAITQHALAMLLTELEHARLILTVSPRRHVNFDGLRPLLQRLLRHSDSLLVVGPGTSPLHEALYDDGYRQQTVIDKDAQARHTKSCTHMLHVC